MNWNDPTVVAAVISGIVALATTLIATFVATPLRHWLDRLSVSHKLRIEYEYEQRKKLRDLIGSHTGEMLEASESLNHRIWNFYKNEDQGWLRVKSGKKSTSLGYYFRTFVFRFLTLFALVRAFERQAYFIDSRVAEKRDFSYAKYLKVMRWSATSVELFDGLPYDVSHQHDHFFTEKLREISDSFLVDGRAIELQNFAAYLKTNSKTIDSLILFFDGMRRSEPRLRWDRLVVMHLVLLAFLNEFGYATQRSSSAQFIEVAQKIRGDEVRRNLAHWLGRLGLNRERGGKRIMTALKYLDCVGSG